jgi:hypothetical protein
MCPPWGDRVWGRVLEVGLGLGVLSRRIAANPRVSKHLILEMEPEIANRCGAGLPVRVGTFPSDVGGEWDCITLDVFDADQLVGEAVELLSDAGAVFVRK